MTTTEERDEQAAELHSVKVKELVNKLDECSALYKSKMVGLKKVFADKRAEAFDEYKRDIEVLTNDFLAIKEEEKAADDDF